LALTEKKYTKMRTDFNLYLGTYSPEKKLNLEAESTKPVAGDPKATPKKNQPATVKEPANQVDKEPANQPVKEQTKEPIKEVSKEPTKETSKTKPKESAAASKPPAKAPPAAPLAVAAEIPANVIDPVMVNKRPSSFEVKPYASQPYACIFETDAKDSLTGLSRLELTPEILFTHTDPDLRPYFKDKDLITCRGRLSAIGPYIYLSIEFQIASSHSQSNFGSLQEGSLLRLKLMNDTYVSLYNLKTNNGRIDPYTGNTIFVGQYAIGKQEMKTIKASALDKMRVMWSTGFEDYDVYNIDLLINQNNCLMSRK
jgi:hypothetical protein